MRAIWPKGYDRFITLSTFSPVILQFLVLRKKGSRLILLTISSGTPLTMTKFRVRFDLGGSIAALSLSHQATLSRLPGMRRARAPAS